MLKDGDFKSLCDSLSSDTKAVTKFLLTLKSDAATDGTNRSGTQSSPPNTGRTDTGGKHVEKKRKRGPKSKASRLSKAKARRVATENAEASANVEIIELDETDPETESDEDASLGVASFPPPAE